MKIETVKTDSIKLNPANPRTIKDEKFAQLVRSVRDFPEMLKIRPIVVNDKMEVLGGNMRLRACIEAGLTDVHIIKASELTDDQQREFIIKDNVGFGEWDWEALGNEWDSEELADWGLDVPDFAFGGKPEAQEDDYEIPDEIETDIVLGDLFEIGPHRLLCGDSTVEANWGILDIEKTAACLTSPPYNAGDSAKLRGHNGTGKGSFYDSSSDNMSDSEYLSLLNKSISNAIKFCGGAVFNVQPLAKNKTILLDWIIENKGAFVDIITWDKGRAAPQMQKCVMTSRFEWLVIYSGNNSSTRVVPLASWHGTVSNVYTAPPQSTNEFSEVHRATFPLHLPVFVMADLMNRCTSIVDCFIGTGTTMVAAHQLNRKCYGMELDPKYCQLIIDRMLKLDPELEIKKNGEKYGTRKETATH